MATNDEDVIAPEDEEENDDPTEDAEGEGKNGEGDGKRRREPESPEARKARLDREVKRHQAKHPDLYKTEDKPAEGKPADGKEPKKLDYGQKAFLAANDIKDKDEQGLALRIMSETGRELDDILDSNYFKAELKALREENAAKDAEPGAKRTRASSPSSVEYWIEKGGLPADTADNRELRTKIVNARMKKEKARSHFTDHSVAGKG